MNLLIPGMAARTVLIATLSLLLAASTGLAEPATETNADSGPESTTPPVATQEQDETEEKVETEPTVDDPAFNPSEEISEDLSVPFPVDI